MGTFILKNLPIIWYSTQYPIIMSSSYEICFSISSHNKSKMSGIQMVRQGTWPYHLNTRHPYCLVFRCSVFRWLLYMVNDVMSQSELTTIWLIKNTDLRYRLTVKSLTVFRILRRKFSRSSNSSNSSSLTGKSGLEQTCNHLQHRNRTFP